jgi:hypothetical protein
VRQHRHPGYLTTITHMITSSSSRSSSYGEDHGNPSSSIQSAGEESKSGISVTSRSYDYTEAHKTDAAIIEAVREVVGGKSFTPSSHAQSAAIMMIALDGNENDKPKTSTTTPVSVRVKKNNAYVYVDRHGSSPSEYGSGSDSNEIEYYKSSRPHKMKTRCLLRQQQESVSMLAVAVASTNDAAEQPQGMLLMSKGSWGYLLEEGDSETDDVNMEQQQQQRQQVKKKNKANVTKSKKAIVESTLIVLD